MAENRYARAWTGSTGGYKAAGNYGATILPQLEAARRGYSQVMWLSGRDSNAVITEVGTVRLVPMHAHTHSTQYSTALTLCADEFLRILDQRAGRT